jgi:cold shock CspA family protein
MHFLYLKVTFNVGQDRRTNQFFARNIEIIGRSSPPVPSIKRYRGIISTMKDSFGFIEREDALKEIFFHITEFGPNVATNTIQPGVEVEFDIQDRCVNFLDFYFIFILIHYLLI